MGQRGKFIRDPTRTEKKTNSKSSGGFIYYSQKVDSMLIVALGSIAADQSKGTTQAEDAVHQFLDY